MIAGSLLQLSNLMWRVLHAISLELDGLALQHPPDESVVMYSELEEYGSELNHPSLRLMFTVGALAGKHSTKELRQYSAPHEGPHRERVCVVYTTNVTEAST